MLTPFVFILMIETGSSPEGIQNAVKTYAKQVTGVYKTQSKHTKKKSRYRTGTISLRNSSLCRNIKDKSWEEGWSTGKLVFG